MTRRWPMRGRFRDAAIACCSLLVVLAGVAYVLAPPSVTLRLSVAEAPVGSVPLERFGPVIEADLQPVSATVSGAVSGAVSGTVSGTSRPRRPWRETFYGVVRADGVPVSGIVLRLRGLGRATRGERADVRIGDPGTYRTVLRLRPGRYRVGLSLLVDGRRRSTSVDRRIRDRRAYAVSLEVREGGVVTMLPVTSY